MSEKNGKDDDEYSKITKIETSISELDKTLDIKYTKLDESKDDKKVKMIKIVNILTKLHDIRRQINNIIGKTYLKISSKNKTDIINIIKEILLPETDDKTQHNAMGTDESIMGKKTTMGQTLAMGQESMSRPSFKIRQISNLGGKPKTDSKTKPKTKPKTKSIAK